VRAGSGWARLPEGFDHSVGILVADPPHDPMDLVLEVDLVVRIRGQGACGRPRGHDDEHDLLGVLVQEARQYFGDGLRRPGDGKRLDKEEDLAPRNHQAWIVVGLTPLEADAEVQGSMRVWQLLPSELKAQGPFEVRLCRVRIEGSGHIYAPSSFATIACAKADVPTSFAPCIRRARSYVTVLAAITA